MDDEGEGQNRRGQEGETLLQWGQRKRPRYRESGLLKTSIRADRRVVRAEKQAAPQSRGNALRPSNVTIQETTFRISTQEVVPATGKRSSKEADGSAVPATTSDYEQAQLKTGYPLLGGDKEDNKVQPPVLSNKEDKAPACTSGDHVGATTFAVRQPETDPLDGKGFTSEKMNMELFEWPKIVISLTRKEKEDDFTAINGTKLPQRPKKRPKTVEKNVQFISPGTWLCDITRERYEVREKKAVKKKPRGLKAMGSVDSDSE